MSPVCLSFLVSAFVTFHLTIIRLFFLYIGTSTLFLQHIANPNNSASLIAVSVAKSHIRFLMPAREK